MPLIIRTGFATFFTIGATLISYDTLNIQSFPALGTLVVLVGLGSLLHAAVIQIRPITVKEKHSTDSHWWSEYIDICSVGIFLTVAFLLLERCVGRKW